MRNMKRWVLASLVAMAGLALGRTVTYTQASLEGLAIVGPGEHTLVLPPDFQPYTYTYRCEFSVVTRAVDCEVPDAPEEEEREAEDPGGEDEAAFRTRIVWSVSGAGASLLNGGGEGGATASVLFSQGNGGDVTLTARVAVECVAGVGVGTEDVASFTVRSPVWDPYHPVSMYAPHAIAAPAAVGAGGTARLVLEGGGAHEYDRREGEYVQTPLDSLVGHWRLPDGFLGADEGLSQEATAPGGAMRDARVVAWVDDRPLPKPRNERGSRDDAPWELEPAIIQVVEVASLLPTIGTEIPDDDQDQDTRTFLVAVAPASVVTVQAVPSPIVAEEELPDAWTLVGGEGEGKLTRTVDRSRPGIYDLMAQCGTSIKRLRLIVFGVSLFAETTNGAINDGTMESLKECMERREITYTALLSDQFPEGQEATVTFYFQRASGENWSQSVQSHGRTAYCTAVADLVANSPQAAMHKFTTQIYCSVSLQEQTAISAPIEIDVYELWIMIFRDAEMKKNWRICVGKNIEYEACSSSDCHSWEWDMEEGVPDAWNPVGGRQRSGNDMVIPYSDLARAANSWFGDTYGEVNVKCYDAEGTLHHFYSTDLRANYTKADVYFPPDVNVDGEQPSNEKPPCWFVFWKEGEVVEKLKDAKWANVDYYGYAKNGSVYLGNAAWQANSGLQAISNMRTGEMTECTGDGIYLNCVAETLSHELYHVYCQLSWGGLSIRDGHSDTDGLPDTDEDTPTEYHGVHFSKTFISNSDTYLYGYPYVENDYSDQEVRCRVVERNERLQIYKINAMCVFSQATVMSLLNSRGLLPFSLLRWQFRL